MPQHESADQFEASAADSAQLRCRACGGMSPRFLSGCVDCGHPMLRAAPALSPAVLGRYFAVSSLVLLMLGVCLIGLLA